MNKQLFEMVEDNSSFLYRGYRESFSENPFRRGNCVVVVEYIDGEFKGIEQRLVSKKKNLEWGVGTERIASSLLLATEILKHWASVPSDNGQEIFVPPELCGAFRDEVISRLQLPSWEIRESLVTAWMLKKCEEIDQNVLVANTVAAIPTN